MVFSTTVFMFLFLPFTLLIYYSPLCRGRKVRNVFLLAVSIGFYAWGEPVYVFLMLLSITVNWAMGLWVEKLKPSGKGKYAVTASAVYNLAVLFVFKYLSFVVDNVALITNHPDWRLNIVLPIGISFFTFQAMSYVIDVYRGKGEVQKNLLNVGLYISFFPQLIAGPIVRYETVAKEIDGRRENFADFSSGVTRFIIGLGKKMLLANNLAPLVELCFDNGMRMSAGMAWLGATAYGFQVFFDFSGYSDMAIGLGRMFGFHFLENFDAPFISRSVAEFWRRWHISLGTWFRDYVYFPLGGSRVSSRARLVFNLFVVWLLTGIWHGANWTYVAWGLMFFVMLAAEKLFGYAKKLGAWGHLYTLFLVWLSWPVVRAPDLGVSARYLADMFGANGFLDGQFYTYFGWFKWYLLAAVAFSLPLKDWARKLSLDKKPAMRAAAGVAVLAVFVISMAFMIKSAYNPFIYFNF